MILILSEYLRQDICFSFAFSWFPQQSNRDNWITYIEFLGFHKKGVL